MKRRALLVLGAESTGTRLLTRMLIAGGCVGDDTHEQRWDKEVPARQPLIVLRRSVPHAGEFVRVDAFVKRVRVWGYQAEALVIWRDFRAAARSQVVSGHQPTEQAAAAMLERAYARIMTGLTATACRWTGVSYEALLSSNCRIDLFKSLGLPNYMAAAGIDVTDENEKHFAIRA